MSVYAGPEITTDGLVVSLDAANPKSYPGTGNTWFDLSINKNNATLVNGPTFVDNTIRFDGSNDYADITLPLVNSYNTITIECICRLNSISGMMLGFTTYDIFMNSGHLGYNNGQSNVIGLNSAKVTELGLLNNFRHYTFVMNKTGLLSANKIYVNAVNQTMTVALASDGNIPGFNTNLRLAVWNNGPGFYGNLNYNYFRVYNRELTQSEIRQNFNALRGRYGI